MCRNDTPRGLCGNDNPQGSVGKGWDLAPAVLQLWVNGIGHPFFRMCQYGLNHLTGEEAFLHPGQGVPGVVDGRLVHENGLAGGDRGKEA